MPTPEATSSQSQARPVLNIITATQLKEGAGFPVRRPFPTAELPLLDPFLLLDEMGPVTWAPGEALGAPDHPHRGFETVTYLLEGHMQHRDSAGHRGDLRPADVQWMTAGAGVVHSEMPGDDLLRDGGPIHGFQLWVNLPAANKMMPPRYQDIPASRIPQAQSDDGSVSVRVIAGQALAVQALIDTVIPITFLHFSLQAGARHEQAVPAGYNVFAYVFAGKARFGEKARQAVAGQSVIFGKGENVIIDVDESAELLLLAGPPLNEPVVRHGPFVMNSETEIVQAIQDHRDGKMGEIREG